jgi:mannose-6-phosphate isomerase-like protein (cupin superfamily)
MKGYVTNIARDTLENDNFRKVLYTAKNMQLVLMSITSGGAIGEEVHDTEDQFIRCEQGVGKAILDGVEHNISDGYAVVIPAGTRHNILNTSQDEPLRLYTLYAPPHHKDGVIHETKEVAEADEEHYDGVTRE